MNIAEFSIRNTVISWTFIAILLIGGAYSFSNLGQLEFPEFTIKDALVITHYPGATPQQVEEEVTLVLEDSIQQMSQVKRITSINTAGQSLIQVSMEDRYAAAELQQVWDELRRKVESGQRRLPPGTQAPIVMDDFADVYGFLINIDGGDFSYRELENYANVLRRELILLPGVKKVKVVGAPREEVLINVSQQDIAALGLDPNYIFAMISNQNVVSDTGKIRQDGIQFRLHPTGEFNALESLESMLVSPPQSNDIIYLSDIAEISIQEQESPSVIYHSNGQKALSLGVSFASGVNVVDVSKSVRDTIDNSYAFLPFGMNVTTVYDQGAVVDTAVSGFLLNLIQSVAIVVIVLLVFMGARSGLLIGSVLVLTIFGTFIIMDLLRVQLQIISLGGLIIALGMLVDNAIVVTEGVIIGIRKGLSKLDAAKQIVKQAQWPLLGATFVAIIAFAPIGFSQDATGEFAGSLFKVLCISLMISWVTAITVTPLFCHLLFKNGTSHTDESNLYKGVLFQFYHRLLSIALNHRGRTISIALLLLVIAAFGMTQVKNAFFPPSNTPIFFVDIWMPEGTDIRTTEQLVRTVEEDIFSLSSNNQLNIENTTSIIGQGIQKFVLPYVPEKNYESYAQIVIETSSLDSMTHTISTLSEYLPKAHPEALFRITRLENGPTPAAKIEARIIGDNPIELRRISAQVTSIFNSEPSATNIRHNWRNAQLMLRPQVDWAKARNVGVSKYDLDNALQYQLNGNQIGVFRDQTRLIPIIARAPENERFNTERLRQLQIWSAEKQNYIPMGQFVEVIATEWEDPIIMRQDRKRVLTVMADPNILTDDTADSVLKKLQPNVDKIELPSGYSIEWGGEYESARDAKAGLFSSLPLGYLAMFIITVLLFNAVKAPLAIWSTVPLAVIGVAIGLLLFNAPFSFMALLGMLSLSGMVVKNGIVLVDQINLELKRDKAPIDAVFDSAVSRVRPVCMAAITTMLGMTPLLFDAFFVSMAVTIIFGLGFATLLTLVILPVVYCLLFNLTPQR